jgi:hypothetical protein
MNRVLQIFVLSLLLLSPLGKDLNAADLRSAIRDGLKDLDARKGETGLCVLTDASYVIIEGELALLSQADKPPVEDCHIPQEHRRMRGCSG